MSIVPWWVNFASGVMALALAVNFFANAYGLRLGGKPLDTNSLPKYEPRIQDQPAPPVPLNQLWPR